MSGIILRLPCNVLLVRPAGFEGFFAGAKSQVLTSLQQCPASYCVFHAMYSWYARQGSKASLLTQSRRFSLHLNNAPTSHHVSLSMISWYARQGSKASLLTQSRRFSLHLNNAPTSHHVSLSMISWYARQGSNLRPLGSKPSTLIR